MKSLVTLFLILAPSLPASAALVFQPDDCACTSDAAPRASDAEALNNQGSAFYAAGDYVRARKTLTEALSMEEKEPLTSAETLASTLFNLAAVARMQSDLPEAEGLYKRTIETRESAYGFDSPGLGRPLAGLALLYHSQGRLSDAIAVAERGVHVTNNSADVRLQAVTQNALATLQLASANPTKAEELELKTIAQLRRATLTSSQEYVDALANLGSAHLRESKYAQAELEFREAESVALNLTGTNHPMVAAIWNNLGKLRAAQNDWRGAEKLFDQAIGAWRKSLGPTHPDVAIGLLNLGTLYQNRKRYAQAEALFERAREIDTAAFGPGSLKVATDWNSLGALSAVRRQYDDAENKLSTALSITRQIVGEDHADTAGIEVNLAIVYLSESKYSKAAELFAKALPVRERILGKNASEVATILRLYAGALKGSHDYVTAERAELQATRITTHNAM